MKTFSDHLRDLDSIHDDEISDAIQKGRQEMLEEIEEKPQLNYEIKANTTTMWNTLNIELPENIGEVAFFKGEKYVAFDLQELNK